MPDEEPAPDSQSDLPVVPPASASGASVGTPALLAWQPITPRGVAAFARASSRRLALVQFLFGLVSAVVVVWFLHHAWFPSVREAIRRLPDQGVIRGKRLVLGVPDFELVMDGRHLGFQVDVSRRSQVAITSDVRVQFNDAGLQVCSLFGCRPFDYPESWEIQFNRPELEPLWGAWQPMVLWMVIVVCPFALLLTWGVLATVYCPLPWLIGYFKDRDLTLAGSWRLAGAALMPGALVMIAAILAYAAGAIDLPRFLVFVAIHFVIPWAYLILGPLALPRLSESRTPVGNPFGGSGPTASVENVESR